MNEVRYVVRHWPGEKAWSVFRINRIGQGWHIATYSDETVAHVVKHNLTQMIEHEAGP